MAALFLAFLFLPFWHESTSGRFVLEPTSAVVVRNSTPGVLTAVYAKEGMFVAAGSPLAQLRNVALESRLDRTQTDYEVAAIQANSASLRYADLGNALQERTHLEQERHELIGVVAGLELTSPISGVVMTPRMTERLGTKLPAGTEVAEIADLHQMRARIYVSEHELYKIKQGQKARLEVQGLLQKWDSKVASVAPVATQMNPKLLQADKFAGLHPPVFYIAELQIANPDSQLKAGMIGMARIYGERRSLAGLTWESVRQFSARKFW